MPNASTLADLPCACGTLRKATRALTRAYDEAMAASGVSIAQFSVLRHIRRLEGASLSRLAEALVMDRTTLYRALAPLERQGWVTVAAVDRRGKSATLTPAGHAAIEGAADSWAMAQGRVHDALGEDDWVALHAALHMLTTLKTGAAA